MAKKIFMTAFAIIVLCLCCGVCFAAEDGGSSVNLGNEIMNSIDKTGKSIDNVVSGNMVNDAANSVRNAGNDVKDGMKDAGDAGRDAIDGTVNRNGNGDYNTTRTTTEGTTTNNNGFSTMTTTTWMWIILVVAAIVIIAAIWYYATRTND